VRVGMKEVLFGADGRGKDGGGREEEFLEGSNLRSWCFVACGARLGAGMMMDRVRLRRRREEVHREGCARDDRSSRMMGFARGLAPQRNSSRCGSLCTKVSVQCCSQPGDRGTTLPSRRAGPNFHSSAAALRRRDFSRLLSSLALIAASPAPHAVASTTLSPDTVTHSSESETGSDSLAAEWLQQLVDSVTGSRSSSSTARGEMTPMVQELLAAFAGGTVGVMLTLVALESWRQRAAEQQLCPYCRGSGRLQCGVCFGIGAVPDETLAFGEVKCESCKGSGAPQCNHCEGSGRLLPIRYDRALRRRQDDFYFGSYDEDGYRVDRSNDLPPY